jgi:hypothetical protein
MIDFKEAAYVPCGHVRRLVGEGRDDQVVVQRWHCDECGDDLLDVPQPSAPETKDE